MSEIVKIYPYKYTPQEELFCELYADTGIISKAYHLAYGRDANYSFDDTKEKKTCHTRGYRMLKKEVIKQKMKEIERLENMTNHDEEQSQ